MSGFAHTGVGLATLSNQYAVVSQVQASTYSWIAAGGTADAITATYAPALTSLTDGLVLKFRATAANATTTPTFAPSGLTARAITKKGGSALVAGDIAAALAEYELVYNLANTRWELANPSVGLPATNTITNAMLAQMGADTVKVNNTSGTANATDLTMGASTVLARLASGDIVAATVAQILTLLGIGSPTSNSISGDVTITTSGTYYDGPSIAQGSTGTWFASGTVTLTDGTASPTNLSAKLWDGTTVIATGSCSTNNSGNPASLTLSGSLSSPAGNLRISVTSARSGSSKIVFNFSGLSKDSTISAFRIA